MRVHYRFLYGAASYALTPVVALAMLGRGWRERGYWRDFGERLGRGRTVGRPSIWVHAVSVGEVQAAAPLVRELIRRHPSCALVLTSTTPAGAARARDLFAESVDVRFAPFDLPGAARRFIARVAPHLAIIMETELWPNLFHECRRHGVLIILASARLSTRSVRRYDKVRGLFAEALAAGVIVAAQTDADAERFALLGAPRQLIQVTGNLKFDLTIPEAARRRGAEIRALLGAARAVWVAGSTHAGEEAVLLAAHRRLLRERADALLILAPRHAPRFAEVAAWLGREQIPFTRSSELPAAKPAAPVLLIDSLGELINFYAAGDSAFVGGTLVPIGGHNPLEPAAIGLPLFSGRHYANSREASELLIEGGALQVVLGADDLAAHLAALFADPGERKRRGEAARATVERNRGALDRLLALIEPLLAGI